MTPSASVSLNLRPARIGIVLLVGAYVAAFNSTYRDLVGPVFDFWGLGYNPPPPAWFWSSVAASVVPAFWMPLGFRRPSLLLFYLQYFLLYIPACFIVYHSSRPSLTYSDAASTVAVMFVGLSILQLSYRAPIVPIRSLRLGPTAFWGLFVGVAMAMVGYLAVTLLGNFRLASFQDIYSVRFAMVDTLRATGSRFGFYAQTLLTSLILPLVFALGVKSRRYWLTLPVLACYVFLFGIGGSKATILALLYLPLGALLFSRRPSRIAPALVAGLTAVLLLGYVTQAVLARREHVAFIGVAHFRMFSIPAQTIPQYLDFFQHHPVTHLSHVTGINWLIRYPYEIDIPYTVGYYYYKTAVGLNAGFWASDGIGGFGLWGILPLSVCCAGLFWLLDSLSADLDPTFVGLALTYCAASFGSVSLFTTLISGGLGFLLVVLVLAPRDSAGALAMPNVRVIPRGVLAAND